MTPSSSSTRSLLTALRRTGVSGYVTIPAAALPRRQLHLASPQQQQSQKLRLRKNSSLSLPLRAFSTTARSLRASPVTPDLDEETKAILNAERVSEEVDVCIVGGGPAGLSAAIRLMQLSQQAGKEIRVVLVEKGAEVGSHILSGAVLEPRALNELIPDWKEKGAPLNQPALKDKMYYMTKHLAIPLPHPPQVGSFF